MPFNDRLHPTEASIAVGLLGIAIWVVLLTLLLADLLWPRPSAAVAEAQPVAHLGTPHSIRADTGPARLKLNEVSPD